MGTKTSQPQGDSIDFSIDQQQIGFDMTLAIAAPITAQVMIPVMRSKWLVLDQQHQDIRQVRLRVALCFPLISRLKSFLKAEERSIVRIQVCHQRIDGRKPLSLSAFKFFNRFSGR